MGETGGDHQKWALDKTASLTSTASAALVSNEALIASLDAKIFTAEARLSWLTQALAQIEDVATLESLLATTQTDLNGARTELASKNTTLLADLASAALAAMPALAVDERGLRTAGAVLDFAQPVGGVRLTESCTGNVLLTYADRQAPAHDGSRRRRGTAATPPSSSGCPMRCGPAPTSATAAISSRWPRTSPCRGAAGAARPGSDTRWPRGRMVRRIPSACLAASADSRSAPLVVRGGQRLGLFLDGWFFDSGIDLSQTLAEGFHHLAVTAWRYSHLLWRWREAGQYEGAAAGPAPQWHHRRDRCLLTPARPRRSPLRCRLAVLRRRGASAAFCPGASAMRSC